MTSLRTSFIATIAALLALGAGCGGGKSSTGTGGRDSGTGGAGGGGAPSSSSSSSSSTMSTSSSSTGSTSSSTSSSSSSSSTSSSGSDGGACTDTCNTGNHRCAGSMLQTCEMQSDGCYDWAAPAACPTNETCLGSSCVLACSDKCIDGNTQCNAGQIQTCAKQSNGCTDWNAATACPSGGTCSGGQCAATCTDQCTSGATKCSGPQIQTCSKQANGCLDYGAAVACPTHQACSGTQCAVTCTDKCTSGATQCSGGQIQTCALQASGCLDWNAAQDCPSGQSCSGNACSVPTCNAGDLQCNGTVLQVCNANKAWQTQQVCAQSCDPSSKACVQTATCTANARRCTGNEIEVCNSTGTAWLGVSTCAASCSAGLCTGACTPGTTRCNGSVAETCNAGGTAWTAGTTCTTACVAGGCSDGALTIDANANATLNGEHWIDGDVVIKNSSVLTVSSGSLILHAKNVTIDASSQIVVTPTGNDSRGKGSVPTVTCFSSSCGTFSVTLPASGGSYGTMASFTSTGFPGFCNCNTPVAINGPAAYAIADDEAATGAAGGNCTTTSGSTFGLGGGLIAIYADTIQVAGTITANGQAGTGCGGGGSGGGVVLRATSSLTVSGSISVAGGSSGTGGAGGQGVVKLLYGNANTITGSIVGQKFMSFMPPTDVSSTSHPSSVRWYNDNFTVFELAWSKPFSNSAGYYYKLNTTYGFVPTPANALFLAPEAQQYPSTALLSGTNDFHVDTIGPFANVGTVEHRFVVNINPTPPSIASSSHPSSTTWYINSSPYLSWSLPHADADVANFYWDFDPFATTIPAKTDNAIPMDLTTPQNSKQILLPNQANGIWYFHVIAEDTMGYLTKAAGHYRVQIGADPGQGSVSGVVKDAATSAFLSGVSVTLNRGVQTVTTDASGGYAFTNNVSAQTYEIRASKAGYKDAVQMVTVAKGVTSTVNLSIGM